MIEPEKGVGEDRRTDLLVIQPTPFCNIDCAYCYLPHRTSKKRMSLAAAEQIFGRLFQFPTVRDAVTVVWHAGEPMVLPPSYYEEMFKLLEGLARPRGIEVTHSIQTNGTLVTEAWCDLIEKWQVQLGVSIDGPEQFHDLNRRYRNGAGSFAKAHSGLKLLQSRNLPLHLISVLTLPSLRQPDVMFDFYQEMKVETVCFNIEEKEGMNADSELVDSPQFVELYRAFLRRFFELAVQHGSTMSVREFDSAFGAIQGFRRGKGINFQTEPFGIVSVDTDGNLSTFSPELLGLDHATYGSFGFGNVIEDDFATIAARIEASQVHNDIQAGVRKCRAECQYYELCGGGAPANKIFENGTADSTETAYCRAHQVGIDVVLDLIERIPPEAHQRLRSQPSAEIHRF